MGIKMEAFPAPDQLKNAAPKIEELQTEELAELEAVDPGLIKQARQKQTVLVTGHAGFIGFHTAKALLERGDKVIGFDSLNSHYDTRLKRERLTMLDEIAKATGSKYHTVRADLCDSTQLHECLETYKVQRVIHLAGQTDKFLSQDKPAECVQNNINSFVSLLEACRHFKIHHLTYASSHAVYGAGFQKPMSERDSANHPQRLDAATQRACELMAHSYSHLFNLPTTGLRFFSVYGPWGRPDSVLFAFTKRILEGKPIQIYNDGRNTRDYTYISDLVEAVLRASDTPAEPNPVWLVEAPDQATSNAPWRLLNVGNSLPVSIEELIAALEHALDKTAIKEYITGPILEKSQSCADVSALQMATQFRPATPLAQGIAEFAAWYRMYHQV
ncbi:NAD-dependent epimerase/dehydratase family protein [Limnobacter sp.]|uniref:NAD-dependent epimerase/dehydratase family protein n=1 Tax=Limnobacter sp. TaxID=2003368 RepID=UPI0027B986D3|nr:NAD-dependent epimerase/dehydratase family protein [Limnobacter sp.]